MGFLGLEGQWRWEVVVAVAGARMAGAEGGRGKD